MTIEEKTQFFEAVAPTVVDMCARRGLPFPSVILGQMALESAYGTSELAINAKNLLGLKSRPERMPLQIAEYYKLGSEQNADGSYTSSQMAFAWFEDWRDCIESYADFLSAARYNNLRDGSAKTWREWLGLVRADGYATSLSYVENVSKIVEQYALVAYDPAGEPLQNTDSPLVTDIVLSPNKDTPRAGTIQKVTIHCVVGQLTATQLGNIFVNPSRQASSNYGIGKDGSVGLYVHESDRSWCSSSKVNDDYAITIEVASDTTHPYAVNDIAFAKLLDLVEDICRRNGKDKLVWIPDKEQNLAYKPATNEMLMTAHRFFAAKSCPGEYLWNRFGYIAEEVTRRLDVEAEEPKDEEPEIITPEDPKEEPSAPVEKPSYPRYVVSVGQYNNFENAKRKEAWIKDIAKQYDIEFLDATIVDRGNE